MKQQEKQLGSFQIIGITTRTSNADEMSGAGKIGDLWKRFYAEGIAEQIPSKMEPSMFAVYHSYESDKTGVYSITLGCKVETGTNPPAGMNVVKIPSQKYAQFTTTKGQMPQVVIETWQNIWQQEDHLKLKRQYSYDFEVYDQRSADPRSAEVDIYTALKS